jgi:hypothetical protein
MNLKKIDDELKNFPDFSKLLDDYFLNLGYSISDPAYNESELLAILKNLLQNVVDEFLPGYQPPTDITLDQEPKLFELPTF